MTIVLSGDGNLGSEMYGDAKLMLAFFVITTVFQVVQCLVLCHHTQIGGDVILAIDGVDTRKLIGEVERKFAMAANKVNGSMFQHRKVLMLNHATDKGLCRIFGRVILTLVAYSSGTFYLLIDAQFTRLLEPYLI